MCNEKDDLTVCLVYDMVYNSKQIILCLKLDLVSLEKSESAQSELRDGCLHCCKKSSFEKYFIV